MSLFSFKTPYLLVGEPRLDRRHHLILVGKPPGLLIAPRDHNDQVALLHGEGGLGTQGLAEDLEDLARRLDRGSRRGVEQAGDAVGLGRGEGGRRGFAYNGSSFLWEMVLVILLHLKPEGARKGRDARGQQRAAARAAPGPRLSLRLSEPGVW